MELVVGTYDEVLLGYRVIEVGRDLQIETNFTDHSHAGCVKCVAISGKGVLASGSTDETINLLNLKKHKELGSLVHHNGSITSLEFHKGFLFSTSEDGKLCLWKNFTWECLRTFKGHKSAVNCVSVHPTGKLALTVGKDRSLHTWNLITGRSAYITNIKQVADIVKWSTDGDKYAIVVNNKIDIYSVENAEIVHTIEAESRINCIEFLTNDVCCYAGEGGKVIFYNIADHKQLHECDTNTTRIKGLCINSVQWNELEKCKTLSIASSEGWIKVYKITENKGKISTDLLAQHDTGFRVTCLAVYSGSDEKPHLTDTVKEETNVTDQIEDNSDSIAESEETEGDKKLDINSGENNTEIGEIDNLGSNKKRKNRKRKSVESLNVEVEQKKKHKEDGKEKQFDLSQTDSKLKHKKKAVEEASSLSVKDKKFKRKKKKAKKSI